MHGLANKTWAFVAVLLAGLSGCGSREPTGDVAGTLTLRGEPVTQGSIVFFEKVGVPAGVAELTPTGQFELERPIPVGKYQVAFQPPPDEAPAGAAAPNRETPLQEVPPKYWSETTSGFTAEVKEGENTFTFDMR